MATDNLKVPSGAYQGESCQEIKTFNVTYAEITVSCGRTKGHESYGPNHMGQMTTAEGTIVFHWE